MIANANSANEDLAFIDSPIKKLDETNLICVFNYLPIADLVRIERVSKFWLKIAKYSWSKLKKLHLHPKKLGMKTIGTKHSFKNIDEDVVDKILKRCGKYLKEIEVPLGASAVVDFREIRSKTIVLPQ